MYIHCNYDTMVVISLMLIETQHTHKSDVYILLAMRYTKHSHAELRVVV